MTVRAYCRCNGGDYFQGESCPIDGWHSPQSLELAKLVRGLRDSGREPRMEELCRAGISEATRARTVVIEFGADESAFDAMTPLGYVIDGAWQELRKSDSRFQ